MPHAAVVDKDTLLCQAEASVRDARRAAWTQLRLAREWALANPPDRIQMARNPLCATTIGINNLVVAAYVDAELAGCLQTHPLAARRLMADAVDMNDRLPLTWQAVAELRLDAWVGRKMVALTSQLADEQAGWVDEQVAEKLNTLPAGRLLKLVEAKVVAADRALAERIAAQRAGQRGVWLGRDADNGSRRLVANADDAEMQRLYGLLDQIAHRLRVHCPDLAAETVDQLRARALGMLANPMAFMKFWVGPEDADDETAADVPAEVAQAIRDLPADKLRPRTVLYVHVAPDMLRCDGAGEGVARAEQLGALTRQQLVDLLGHEQVLLKPVIDLNDGMAADCYEVPDRISEQLGLARPYDVFPFATSLSSQQDKDHTEPYDWTGPPERRRRQTRLDNLGRMVRRHHRIKTFGGWKVWQKNHTFFWLSPHGRVYVTDRNGTQKLELHPGDLTLAWEYARAN